MVKKEILSWSLQVTNWKLEAWYLIINPLFIQSCKVSQACKPWCRQFCLRPVKEREEPGDSNRFQGHKEPTQPPVSTFHTYIQTDTRNQTIYFRIRYLKKVSQLNTSSNWETTTSCSKLVQCVITLTGRNVASFKIDFFFLTSITTCCTSSGFC